MNIEVTVGNHYSDLISDDVLAHLSDVCEIALQAIRRETVASRSAIAPTTRIGSYPAKVAGDQDTNPAVVSVGKDVLGRIGTV